MSKNKNIDEMSDKEKIDNNLCPNCATDDNPIELQRSGGCARCVQCGYSLCG